MNTSILNVRIVDTSQAPKKMTKEKWLPDRVVLVKTYTIQLFFKFFSITFIWKFSPFNALLIHRWLLWIKSIVTYITIQILGQAPGY